MESTASRLKSLFDLKKSNEIFRLGKLFKTENIHYFYDLGTSKVLQLDDEAYEILNFLFDRENRMDWDDFVETLGDKHLKALDQLEEIIEDENLFLAPKMERLYTRNHCENLENIVNNDLKQVILELTGKCNLRCGYCIYNDDYDGNRNFNSNDMNKEVAKAAIDYTIKHSNGEVAVTFYGGEPLLNFELLKWSMEYAKETIKDRTVTFSFTTNLTLVTKEIAEYLSTVDNLTVLCSLDGPEEVQNSYRKYVDGRGTFNDAIRGLKYLVQAFEKNDTNTISINGVFAPPYSFEKAEKVNRFFQELSWLPESTDINVTYPSDGSIKDSSAIQELLENPIYIKEGKLINTLYEWSKEKIDEFDLKLDDTKMITMGGIQKRLLGIHNRRISKEPLIKQNFNGCCVPGSRRLYVDTKGDFYLCERIGNSPSIGNVYDGMDFDKIKKYYIEDYSNGSIEECSKCWASALCYKCYAENYTKDGFNKEYKNSRCDSVRDSIEDGLSLYHYILETNPEKLDILNEIETI
ncbi:Fe-S oxidoreductase [Clostridium bornimense]|uniref:Fe-S oxidoreductase n=1 Tax=Clostridium bornimense TaxID=1216932 RepID=W6RWI9_9CLOT|nr:radical SAM protein [Clostridium bornimense]CDM67999.1 Fe-S oxidoreductase [Clostridium bornimense]